MRYNDAYKLLYENMHAQNPIIRQIIEGIIAAEERGIPLLINRNPTISYGSLVQVYCTKIIDGYTMALNLQILEGLAADFDKPLSIYAVTHICHRWLIAGKLREKSYANQQLFVRVVQRLVGNHVEPKLMGLGSDGKHVKTY